MINDLQRADFLRGWDKRFIEQEAKLKELEEQVALHKKLIDSLMIQNRY